ncbi:hypothetical protein GN958_ATG07352 [Phytophthora infestans]|uniref:Uncharacterized protein n=1 Tax=Phytophthora infestans TaxID=4787 RepID=A0A8S9UR96_PHYIN|nr:hypothetical protein GN958_ATG07352 [Phytophthora infestans]
MPLVFHDYNESEVPLELCALLNSEGAECVLKHGQLTLGEHTWKRERSVVRSVNKMHASVVELWL